MVWQVEPVKSVNDTWYDIYWFHALKLSQVVVRCQTTHEFCFMKVKGWSRRKVTQLKSKLTRVKSSNCCHIAKAAGRSACLSLMTIIIVSKGSNCCKIFRILAWTTTQKTRTKTEFWSTSEPFLIFRLYIFVSIEKNKPSQKITFQPNDRNARKFYHVSINNLPVRSDVSKMSSC